jgi:hypothetical protein
MSVDVDRPLTQVGIVVSAAAFIPSWCDLAKVFESEPVAMGGVNCSSLWLRYSPCSTEKSSVVPHA